MARITSPTKIAVIFLALILAGGSALAVISNLQVVGKPHKSDDEFVGRKDINGRLCAAIQVVSDLEGLAYDSHNGIVGDIDHRPGFDMIYLQPDEKVLTVFMSGYEPLKIILSEIGIRLKSREVWKIKITGEKQMGDAAKLGAIEFVLGPGKMVDVVLDDVPTGKSSL